MLHAKYHQLHLELLELVPPSFFNYTITTKCENKKKSKNRRKIKIYKIDKKCNYLEMLILHLTAWGGGY